MSKHLHAFKKQHICQEVLVYESSINHNIGRLNCPSAAASK